MWKSIKEWAGIIAGFTVILVAFALSVAILLARLVAVPALIIVIIYLLLTM